MSTRAELVHTASPERTLEERDLAAMRPATEPAPRARKPRAVREVTSGIVCFCGERFPEARALEFMRHLRAEVGEMLGQRERRREYNRQLSARRTRSPEWPEILARKNALRRKYFQEHPEAQARQTVRKREYLQANPEARARRNALERERRRERRQNDPEWRERQNEASRRRYVDADPEARARRLALERERQRERRQNDPELRARDADRKRRRRAARKAEQQAAGLPSAAGATGGTT